MSDTGPNPPFERLLAHMGWLRRLARSLIRDPGEVDDVVQETWVAALEHSSGEAPVRDERAWLGGVFRNVMRQTRRARARAVRREGLAARSEALPPTDDVVVQADLQIRMLQAVVALHEPYRSTLWMRYFEELSAEEIGRRIGEPASTVRNRHKRALELLRERFDREHGGDRRAWCLLLVPIAVPKGAGAAAAALAAVTTTGAWTMSMQFLAATVSIAVLGWGSSVTYRALTGPSEASVSGALEARPVAGPEPEPTPVAAGTLATSPAPRAGQPGESQGQERQPVPVQESVQHVLRGRVVDTESRPVAGARVFVGGRPSPWDGPVEAGLVLASERNERELDQRTRKLEAEGRRRIELDPDANERIGAEPELHEERDADVAAEDHEEAKHEVRREKSAQEQPARGRQLANKKLDNAELHREALEGKHLVIDLLELERPLEGPAEWREADLAKLEASSVVLGKHLVTDAEGRFELLLARPTELFVTLEARPGLRKTHLGAWHRTPAEDLTLTVERVPTATVGLRLTDAATGQAVPRWIGEIARNGHVLTDWEASGREEQVLELPLDERPHFTVTVRQPVWARQSLELELVAGALREVELHVDSGVGLRGAVVDAQGQPLAGALVYWGVALDLRGNTIFGDYAAERVYGGVVTGADGAFDLPGRARWVTAWHAEHSPLTVAPEEAGLVRLPARGHITGTVPVELRAKLGLEAKGRLAQELAHEEPVSKQRVAKEHVAKERAERGQKAAPTVWLDRRVRGEIDAQGQFSFPSVEAGVHAISIGEHCFTGVHVRPGETTHVALDAPLATTRVELRAGVQPFRSSARIHWVGLDPVFTLGEVELHPDAVTEGDGASVLGLLGQRKGRYVLYTEALQIGFFELDGAEWALADLGDADLTIHGTPERSVYLVPDALTGNAIVQRVASLFQREIPASGVLAVRPLPVGRYAIYDPEEGVVAEVDVKGPGASVVLR